MRHPQRLRMGPIPNVKGDCWPFGRRVAAAAVAVARVDGLSFLRKPLWPWQQQRSGETFPCAAVEEDGHTNHPRVDGRKR